MKRVIFAFCFIVIAALCSGTFLERMYGTEWAHRNVYGSWWFVIMWAIFAIGVLIAVLKRRMWVGSKPVCLLHLSFVVILLGGFLTFMTGEKGTVHLRKGVPSVRYLNMEGKWQTLPFGMILRSFTVRTYQGTDTPSDYVSRVTVEGMEYTISMNNILRYKGYRFYQTSFDSDRKGTVLSINHDPYGIFVTYLGYALFFISFVLVLFNKDSSLLKAYRKLKVSGTFVAVLLFVAGTSYSNTVRAEENIVLSRVEADSLVRMPIVYQDRIAPFNTMAEDVVRKLYGSLDYKGLSAEQIVASFILYPKQWANEKIIMIKSGELRDSLRIDGKYASINDLYDSDGTYKLQKWWNPMSKDALSEQIAATDEKVAIIAMLRNGSLYSPVSSNITAEKKSKIEVEVLYNRLNKPALFYRFNLTLGLVAFVFFVLSAVGVQPPKSLRYKNVNLFMCICMTLSLFVMMVVYGLRWYISDHIPLSNGYETMVFISIAVLALSEFFCWRSLLFTSGGLLLSGFTCLVANLNTSNPQITSLMPVLSSSWLSLHVLAVMISYALFLFATFVSLSVILIRAVKPKMDCMPIAEDLRLVVKILLLPAEWFLGCGIFIGAIWANVSWGAYWSWDPKEVWALITFMIYAILLHDKMYTRLNSPVLFHLFVAVAFLSLLMTYFGVNLLFTGMHSYK